MAEVNDVVEQRNALLKQVNDLRLRLKDALSNNYSMEETIRKLSEKIDILEADKANLHTIIAGYSKELEKYDS